MTVDVHALHSCSQIPRQGLPTSAVVVGDPARAAAIAHRLDDAHQVASNREWTTYRGAWRSTDLLVASHGVGGPGALCLFQELIEAGVRTIIRFGTAGAVAPEVQPGDLLVAEGAVREDGVTDQLVPVQYPALCSPEVVLALESAARDHSMPYHRGVVWTRALFYPGLLPSPSETYKSAGVVGIEMELSALLVVGSVHQARCGGLLVVDGTVDEEVYDPYTETVATGVANGAAVALDALHTLAVASTH